MARQIKIDTQGKGAVTSIEVDGIRIDIGQEVPAVAAEPAATPSMLDALYRPQMVKIGADGKRMADDATGHVAVLLPQYGLMYDARASEKASNWAQAVEMGSACDLLGFTDWELWDDVQAQLILRRDLPRPFVDTNFFPNIPTSDWTWTRTRYSPSPSDFAFSVYFNDGLVLWSIQDDLGFVRACRRVPASQVLGFLAGGSL